MSQDSVDTRNSESCSNDDLKADATIPSIIADREEDISSTVPLSNESIDKVDTPSSSDSEDSFKVSSISELRGTVPFFSVEFFGEEVDASVTSPERDGNQETEDRVSGVQAQNRDINESLKRIALKETEVLPSGHDCAIGLMFQWEFLKKFISMSESGDGFNNNDAGFQKILTDNSELDLKVKPCLYGLNVVFPTRLDTQSNEGRESTETQNESVVQTISSTCDVSCDSLTERTMPSKTSENKSEHQNIDTSPKKFLKRGYCPASESSDKIELQLGEETTDATERQFAEVIVDSAEPSEPEESSPLEKVLYISPKKMSRLEESNVPSDKNSDLDPVYDLLLKKSWVREKEKLSSHSKPQRRKTLILDKSLQPSFEDTLPKIDFSRLVLHPRERRQNLDKTLPCFRDVTLSDSYWPDMSSRIDSAITHICLLSRTFTGELNSWTSEYTGLPPCNAQLLQTFPPAIQANLAQVEQPLINARENWTVILNDLIASVDFLIESLREITPSTDLMSMLTHLLEISKKYVTRLLDEQQILTTLEYNCSGYEPYIEIIRRLLDSNRVAYAVLMQILSVFEDLKNHVKT